MLLILPASIVVNELDPVKEFFPIATIIKAARKAQAGLGTEIRGAPSGGRFLKVYLTSKTTAGRALFLLHVQDQQITPLLIRTKHDRVGNNMSPSNPAFVTATNKNLRLAIKDMSDGFFETVEI